MALRSKAEVAAAVLAFALCAAFVVSFIFGLRDDAPPPAEPQAGPPELTVPAPDAGKIEVLNASGRSGVARTATDRLRAAGFDVVYFGNAAVPGDTSIVLARTNDDAVARDAARRLGIAQVRTQPDSTMFLDATVVLGNDWPKPSERAPARDDGWWARFRRWLK